MSCVVGWDQIGMEEGGAGISNIEDSINKKMKRRKIVGSQKSVEHFSIVSVVMASKSVGKRLPHIVFNFPLVGSERIVRIRRHGRCQLMWKIYPQASLKKGEK